MGKYSPHTSDILIKVEVILYALPPGGGDSTQKTCGLRFGLIQDI